MLSPVEERVCRECWEDTGEPLLAPCACVGTLRFVHERCLPDDVTHGDNFSCPTPMVCGVCREPMDLEGPAAKGEPGSGRCAGLRGLGCALGAVLLLLHMLAPLRPSLAFLPARGSVQLAALPVVLLLAAAGLALLAPPSRRMPVIASKVRPGVARLRLDAVAACPRRVCPWSARLLSRGTPSLSPASSPPGSPRDGP